MQTCKLISLFFLFTLSLSFHFSFIFSDLPLSLSHAVLSALPHSSLSNSSSLISHTLFFISFSHFFFCFLFEKELEAWTIGDRRWEIGDGRWEMVGSSAMGLWLQGWAVVVVASVVMGCLLGHEGGRGLPRCGHWRGSVVVG